VLGGFFARGAAVMAARLEETTNLPKEGRLVMLGMLLIFKGFDQK